MKLKLLKGSNKLLSTSKVGTQEIKDGKSNLEIGSFIVQKVRKVSC